MADVFILESDKEIEDGHSRSAIRVYSCAWEDRYGSWVPKAFITPYEPQDTRVCVRVEREGVGIGIDDDKNRYNRCKVTCHYNTGAFPGAAAVEDFEPRVEALSIGGYRKFQSTGTFIDVPITQDIHYRVWQYSRTIDYNSLIDYQISKSEGTLNSRYSRGHAPGTLLMEASRIRKYQNPDTLITLMDVQLSFKVLPSTMGATWNHVWNADLPGWDDSLDYPPYQYSDFDFFGHI